MTKLEHGWDAVTVFFTILVCAVAAAIFIVALRLLLESDWVWGPFRFPEMPDLAEKFRNVLLPVCIFVASVTAGLALWIGFGIRDWVCSESFRKR